MSANKKITSTIKTNRCIKGMIVRLQGESFTFLMNILFLSLQPFLQGADSIVLNLFKLRQQSSLLELCWAFFHGSM